MLRIFYAVVTTVLFFAATELLGAEATGSSEPAQPIGNPVSLELQPQQFDLLGVRAKQQLAVTGNYSAGEVRDLTTAAKFSSSNPKVVRIEGSQAIPVTNGTAELTATVGSLSTKVNVTVKLMEQEWPVSFNNDTLAALTKAGCNMGACHGSPSGKGGFRLSLRGYDPPLDILTLRSEFFGRRANLMQPAESLLLKKPLMEVAHGGGKRLQKNGPAYSVLHDWVAEGMKLDSEATATLEKIEVWPKKRIFQENGNQQQLLVFGTYSDGTVRDITPLTVFTSSNESVAVVSKSGQVTKIGRGESTILAAYVDKMTTSDITFLENVPGFAWTNPPTNNFVDEIAYRKLKQLQILPSELCTDAEFIRRAYLDTTGRLPSLEETEAFLKKESSNKRNALIDHLLSSNDFASFWTLKWGDILRSNSKKLKAQGVHKFRRWIFSSIHRDQPADEFARELLTASGSVFENPPASYWRASRDPHDATETTAQLFLGVRIQCAKCHNHPFEKWSQDNYYGIAAAFTRIGRKTGTSPDEEIIYPTTSGEITQPRTGKQMKVHLLLKGDVDVPDTKDRREVFAEWLTAPDNPFFARAAVNRIWGHLMGRGIVEPVDDFRDSNPPSNAELLDRLAAEFVKQNFSRKWVVKTIMQSRLYQLSSRTNKFNADDEIYNSHAHTRLMSAEQLLDAICAVTNVPEIFPGMPPGTRAVELVDPPTNHYFLKVFGQPQREMACQCERSNESNLAQALQMINGPVVHTKLRNGNGRIHKMISQKKTDEEIITALYLAAVSRLPVEAELAAAKRHLSRTEDRNLALEDIGWAILNSKEFLFQH